MKNLNDYINESSNALKSVTANDVDLSNAISNFKTDFDIDRKLADIIENSNAFNFIYKNAKEVPFWNFGKKTFNTKNITIYVDENGNDLDDPVIISPTLVTLNDTTWTVLMKDKKEENYFDSDTELTYEFLVSKGDIDHTFNLHLSFNAFVENAKNTFDGEIYDESYLEINNKKIKLSDIPKYFSEESNVIYKLNIKNLEYILDNSIEEDYKNLPIQLLNNIIEEILIDFNGDAFFNDLDRI